MCGKNMVLQSLPKMLSTNEIAIFIIIFGKKLIDLLDLLHGGNYQRKVASERLQDSLINNITRKKLLLSLIFCMEIIIKRW